MSHHPQLAVGFMERYSAVLLHYTMLFASVNRARY
jgi:hypothetical protein